MKRILAGLTLVAGLAFAASAHGQSTTTSTTTRTEGAGGVEITSTSNTSSATHTSSSSHGSTTTSSVGPSAPSNNVQAPAPPQAPSWNAPSTGNGGFSSSAANAHGAVFGPPPPNPGMQNPAMMPPMDMGPIMRIVLYDNANFRGHNIGITHDTPNLTARRFSSIASAARVQGGAWELCSLPNYGGTCHRVDADTDLDAAGYGDTVQSVRMVQ